MSALALGPVGESDELRSRRGWEFRGMHCGNRCVEFYTRRFLSVNNCRYNWRKKTRQGGMVVIFGLVAVAYSCCAMVECSTRRFLSVNNCRYNWRKKTRQGGMVVIFGLVAVAYSCCAMVDRRHRFACAIQRLLIRHRCGRCTAPTRPRSSLGRQTAGGLRFF